MNKLIITTVAISVGFWAQFANAYDYYDIGTSMTAEQLAANHCIRGSLQGACLDPIDWSFGLGNAVTDCKEWFIHTSCTQCHKGYERYESVCIPNNETGYLYKLDCMYDQMTDEQKAKSRFAYGCRCDYSYHETGVDGYLFRGDDGSCGSIEYKCDTGNKYYPVSTVKCTVSTDSNGDFKFTRCSGCKVCDEDTEFWTGTATGYQRSYYNKLNVNGDSATCDNVYNNKWRCAANYYGTSSNGTSGCNPCPTLASLGLTAVCNSSGSCPYVKSNPGSTQITQCFAGTWEPDLLVYLKDGTGTFHWYPVDDVVNAYGECYYK